MAACTNAPGTLPSPAAPTNLIVTPGADRITLAWTDNSADETGFSILRRDADPSAALRAQQGDFQEIDTVPGDTTSYDDTTMTRGSWVQYRVVATGPSGTSAPVSTPDDEPVALVNGAPSASAQTLSTSEDTPLQITLEGSDPEGDPLTFTVVTGPENGSLSGTVPTLTYTPTQDFAGPDGFTFEVSDGQDVASATVTIDVSAVNDPPSFIDSAGADLGDSVAVQMDEDGTPTAFHLVLDAADVDDTGLFWSVAEEGAANGLAAVDSLGVVSYTPVDDYHGSDSFVVEVSDGEFSDAVTVSVTISPVADLPKPGDDSGETDALTLLAEVADGLGLGGTVTTLLANDLDPDGGPLTVTDFDATSAQGAAVTVSADGTFSYDPTLSAVLGALCLLDTLDDTFTYTVADAGGLESVATVTITVSGLVVCL